MAPGAGRAAQGWPRKCGLGRVSAAILAPARACRLVPWRGTCWCIKCVDFCSLVQQIWASSVGFFLDL